MLKPRRFTVSKNICFNSLTKCMLVFVRLCTVNFLCTLVSRKPVTRRFEQGCYPLKKKKKRENKISNKYLKFRSQENDLWIQQCIIYLEMINRIFSLIFECIQVIRNSTRMCLLRRSLWPTFFCKKDLILCSLHLRYDTHRTHNFPKEHLTACFLGFIW